MDTKQIITLIMSANVSIKKHEKAVYKARSVRVKLFRDLSNICEHKDPNRKHCRHRVLKERAKVAGANAFQNGCFRQICPLLPGSIRGQHVL